jgi:hypothetical protein
MSVDDKVNRQLLDQLLEGLDIEITVGIHAAEGSASHGADLTMAELGAIHEFGLGVPARSFVRGYFDENQAAIESKQDAALQRILLGANPRTEAERMALELESGMKERILGRIAPPLAESTKRRRGAGAVPLVATSQLLGSIRGKVTER